MQFADLVRLAASVRHKDGPKNHALWRMHPERWLESLVASDISALDGRLRPESGITGTRCQSASKER